MGEGNEAKTYKKITKSIWFYYKKVNCGHYLLTQTIIENIEKKEKIFI